VSPKIEEVNQIEAPKPIYEEDVADTVVQDLVDADEHKGFEDNQETAR